VGFRKLCLGFFEIDLKGKKKKKKEQDYAQTTIKKRKVTAQPGQKQKKNNKKDTLYQMSIEIVFFIYLGTLFPTRFFYVR
ncbi:IS5/IS1182 family transposase, partial [Staphylococcus epidermidis]